MIVVLKPGTGAEKKEKLIQWLEHQGMRVHISDGDYQTVLGIIGDASRLDLVSAGGVPVGGGHFAMIAGPCSVETEEQILTVAKAVKAAGADLLRGGAFKPRTSPYDFSGLKARGLELLRIARAETGLPIVTELMDIRDLELFSDVDVIQVGARNMQNFDLLRELGHCDKPILLKRGLANTLRELLMSAEYIMAGGNEQVILCERGIRTFADYTRNTLDPLRGAGAPRAEPSAGGRGSQPCHGPFPSGALHGFGRRCRRGGRPDDRGAQRSHPRPLRRGPVPAAGGIRAAFREGAPDPKGRDGMTVGVVGLGLIGGSFVKAYHEAGHRVLTWNRNPSMLEYSMLSGESDGMLDESSAKDCDLILLCVYPEAAIDWLREMAPNIGPRPMVIDCCGTKQVVCEACFPLAQQYGIIYLGGHPMAGSHFSGYAHARADLYHGASMVLVPPTFDDIELLSRAKELLSPAGFGRYPVTTAEKHDASIAFTSQLAHLVSNAYVKSPTALEHHGFSAGSYRDMTRVAWLNAPMWTELFLENRDNLLRELDLLIENLGEYRDALERRDARKLESLLEEGKRRKEEVDQ